jgi:hypothetical protein
MRKRSMDALIANGYSFDVLDMGSLSVDSDTIPTKKGETWMVLTVTRGRRHRNPRGRSGGLSPRRGGNLAGERP